MATEERSGPRVAVVLEQCWHRVPGGTARAALDSVDALLACTDLRLIGVAARHREPPVTPWRPAIPVRQLPLGRRVLYELWHGVRWPTVQAATGSVDVIHATGLAVPPPSAPLVVTINDLAFVHEPAHFTPHGLRFFHRSLELTARDADIVVVPSEATRRDCLDQGIDARRLVMVPYGIDAELVDLANASARLAALGVQRPFILWVGTVEPRKNLGTVVAVHRELRRRRDVDLVLVGPAGWHTDLEGILGADRDGVHVLGFLSSDDLRAAYRAASVCLYPSLREGFGLPVLEAMAQATAVVTSRGTATEEVVGSDGRAGAAVDPLDVDALVDAVDALLEPDVGARAGAAARGRAGLFTWAATAAGLESAYGRAVAGGAS